MRHRLAVALGAALYGGITVGGRYFADRGFSLLEIALTGVLFGALTLSPWVLSRRERWPARADLDLYVSFGVVGALLQLAQFGGIVAGVPVAVVALLLYTQPVWTVLLGRVLLAEPVTGRKLLAAALALGGTVVLLDPFSLDGRAISAVGLAASLVAGLMLSLWVVLGRIAALRAIPAVTVSFGYAATTTLLLIVTSPVLAALLADPAPSRLDPASWAAHWKAVGLYTLAVNVAPALLVLRGMSRVDASTAGVLLLFEPVAAALGAAWLFSEALTGNVVAGGLLVLGANGILVSGGPTDGERG